MDESFELQEYIMHHMQDAHVWHLPFLPPIQLPSFLSLHVVMQILCGFFLIWIFCFLYNKKTYVPTGLTNLLEVFVVFIRDDIAIKNLGEEDGRRMTPMFCTFFFFILVLNLMGLVPIFVTATANVNITGALALITFSFMVFGAIYKNGLKGFWQALTPPGVPWPLLILLIPTELVSLLIKTFALMIRLSANMLGGHIVIFCLLGLVVILGAKALPSIILAIFVSLLEVFVAFLQAYIFTLLSATFIGQMYRPQH